MVLNWEIAQVAFRSISAAVLLGHLIAHVLHRNEGLYYFMYLTHWTMSLGKHHQLLIGRLSAGIGARVLLLTRA